MTATSILEQEKSEEILTAKNVYVECGDDKKDGYIECNIRETSNAKIICKAWELSKHVKGLENIYSRHMCEHLTFKEFRETLKDWYAALAENGLIHIIVPNMDFHIKQWLNAKFDIENLYKQRSNLNWSIADFTCQQKKDGEEEQESATKYWDVHKSGYNDKLIRIFLEETGFVHITCEIIDDVHLSVFARKPISHDFSLKSGERQYGICLTQIREDHINRYKLAADIINKIYSNKLLKGLDIFCGNGYGEMLLTNLVNTQIIAYDASKEAIELAKKYYKNDRSEFICKKFPFELNENEFDFIISLESLEHVKEYKLFIKELSKSLKNGGILIISSPNELKNSLIKNNNPFHYRHFKPDEILELFQEYKLQCIESYGQDCYQFDKNGYIIGTLEPDLMDIKKEYDGQFIIYVLKKL